MRSPARTAAVFPNGGHVMGKRAYSREAAGVIDPLSRGRPSVFLNIPYDPSFH
jgi:hypothetical protein